MGPVVSIQWAGRNAVSIKKLRPRLNRKTHQKKKEKKKNGVDFQ
jgi:hypothetical protein